FCLTDSTDISKEAFSIVKQVQAALHAAAEHVFITRDVREYTVLRSLSNIVMTLPHLRKVRHLVTKKHIRKQAIFTAYSDVKEFAYRACRHTEVGVINELHLINEMISSLSHCMNIDTKIRTSKEIDPEEIRRLRYHTEELYTKNAEFDKVQSSKRWPDAHVFSFMAGISNMIKGVEEAHFSQWFVIKGGITQAIAHLIDAAEYMRMAYDKLRRYFASTAYNVKEYYHILRVQHLFMEAIHSVSEQMPTTHHVEGFHQSLQYEILDAKDGLEVASEELEMLNSIRKSSNLLDDKNDIRDQIEEMQNLIESIYNAKKLSEENIKKLKASISRIIKSGSDNHIILMIQPHDLEGFYMSLGASFERIHLNHPYLSIVSDEDDPNPLVRSLRLRNDGGGVARDVRISGGLKPSWRNSVKDEDRRMDMLGVVWNTSTSVDEISHIDYLMEFEIILRGDIRDKLENLALLIDLKYNNKHGEAASDEKFTIPIDIRQSVLPSDPEKINLAVGETKQIDFSIQGNKKDSYTLKRRTDLESDSIEIRQYIVGASVTNVPNEGTHVFTKNEQGIVSVTFEIKGIAPCDGHIVYEIQDRNFIRKYEISVKP
ncbi:MAG: hypothetical protein P1Q69_10045, partial [Candidatus Thorarchaeota archaeon]|nr:hypothetical protein [Candidatus Thorarchaeota archaeon]